MGNKGITVPSGRYLTASEVSLVRDLGNIGTIAWSTEPITLKSGITSHVYVHGRNELTGRAPVLRKVGYRIWSAGVELQQKYSPDKDMEFIGIPTAGSPLATAASLASTSEHPAGCRTMREKVKSHGTHNSWVDGSPNDELFFISVDNVVTDGGSKFEAVARLTESGYRTEEMGHIILVDRQQGAIERMKQAGMTRLTVIFNLLDMTYLFGRFGVWPSDAVERVEREIKEFQQKNATK